MLHPAKLTMESDDKVCCRYAEFPLRFDEFRAFHYAEFPLRFDEFRAIRPASTR